MDPSFDNVLQEIHGCMDRPTGILKKFNGKCLNTTGVSSPVWSINQLRFSNRITNVRRVGSTVEAYPDYFPIAPFIPLPKPAFTDPSQPSQPGNGGITTPPWNPPDWPESGPKAPTVAKPVPAPAKPTNTGSNTPINIKMKCVPSAVTLTLPGGPTSTTIQLDKYVDVGSGGGFSSVRVTWPLSATWISVATGYISTAVANGGVFETTWSDGGASEAIANVTISTDNTAPMGTTTVTPVTFTLVSSVAGDSINNQTQVTGRFNTLIGYNNQPVSAVCAVSVANPIPRAPSSCPYGTPPVFTVTGSNILWDPHSGDGVIGYYHGCLWYNVFGPNYRITLSLQTTQPTGNFPVFPSTSVPWNSVTSPADFPCWVQTTEGYNFFANWVSCMAIKKTGLTPAGTYTQVYLNALPSTVFTVS